MNSVADQFIWANKYRPKEVDQLIATPEIRDTVNGILSKGQIPNLLLVGPSGIGKTTIALLLVEKLQGDAMLINASLKGNIDTLRNEIQAFASTRSLVGGRKYVILDEADFLNPTSTQPALRNFIDTFSGNCGFILTANYKNRLLPELIGRTESYEFKIEREELPLLLRDFTKRAGEILTAEGVEFDPKVLAQFALKKAPNWRSAINDLQGYARRRGKIDAGLLGVGAVSNASVEKLIPMLKSRDFNAIRSTIAEAFDTSGAELFSEFVRVFTPALVPQSVADMIIIVARYQYQAAFVPDQQINFAACLAEIMAECQFA